ncbi:MAG: endosialidase [Firmicutes bacterium]|nr:endosialidase [Bacillota bacterium]
MSVIKDVIVLNDDNTLSFGNYEVADKQKVEFEANGNLYKVRTHKDVTRLSKNTQLLLETVPGAAVHNLKVTEKEVTFSIEGKGGTQVTLELENDSHYTIYIDDVSIGNIATNFAGKISFGMELNSAAQSVKIEKH